MPDAHPEELAGRLAALPGIERVRSAAGGVPVHIVGGAVRDLLLGRDPPSNIDLVVEGDVEPIAARLGGEARSHERFETATVRVDGREVDLARARSETYPHPGALPEVTPADLRTDLARRDFTINAMAVPLTGEPELIDVHGGLDDLGAGLLRVLHDASFVDDPTRALRAARYAARLDFEVEPETLVLLRRADLGAVSRERVVGELRRLAREEARRRAFELIGEWGILSLPADALELIGALGQLGSPWPEIADAEAAVVAAALGETAEADALAGANPERPSAAAALARGVSGTTLILARAMGAEWLDRYVREWRDVRLEITGDDLLANGVERGPAIGRGLKAALDAKLDGELDGREEELAVALEAARAT
jgi:tRNA nucleotidyltransferase (CCA-adding enzyme)